MSRDEVLEHQTFGLSGRALCLALFSKYLGLAIYGIWAAIVEIPTFVLVTSSPFAVAWAASVAVFAGLAAVGVARTWTSGRYRLEVWTTFAFSVTFVGYSFALVWRAVTTANWDAAPLALIPIAITVLPIIRYYSLIIHAKAANARHDREATS